MFLSVAFLSFTHTIYTLITHKIKMSLLRRKPQRGFYNTPTILERVTHPCVKIPQQSLLLSLPHCYTLRRDLYPKHNSHLFKVQRVFTNLGSFRDLPKEASEAQRMQSGVMRDPESQRRHGFEKPCQSRSLEGLLLLVYPNLLSSRSIYCLEGSRGVFHQVLQFPL